MRYLSVCSGIEAASVAWGPLGWQAAAFSEIEPFPCAVLAHHYPDVPNLGDMTKLPDRILRGDVEAPDLLCGGTPCQAFSVAGLRRSLDDERGNLSLTFCEIADAIDFVRVRDGRPPAIVFWENVPGVLNTKDNAFGCFLGALAGEDCELKPPGKRWADAGCVFGPARTIAWRVLDAQYFGLAQRRRRVFVVASARDGFDPATVLFEFDGVRRDTAPSREAGEAVAGTFKACASSGGWSNSADHAAAGYMQPVAQPVITMAHGQGGAEIGFDRGPTLTCNHEAPIAAYPVAHVETMPTMTAGGPSDTSHNQVSGQMRDAYIVPTTTHSLRGEGFDAGEDGTGRGAWAVAFPWMSALDPIGKPDNISGTLIKNQIMGCMDAAMQVRRLTPRECERLQGFPDNYTAIPWRGKPADQCPDGPRYKALGNSWAVPVVRWIGERIHALHGVSGSKD